MAEPAIVVDALTKRFGDLVAVDHASFTVPRGEVTGFLGPNGSGKTTTLGMITGLVPPDSGNARVAGSFGAMVEEPAFYPQLSGARNLRVVARLVGASASAAEEKLVLVGLEPAADQKYKAYSQGMRRRLGLAAALLPEPDVLLLDEPTNGLDPAGQLQMRSLLRGLAAKGRTVFVSSHLLYEVQESCTHAVVLRKGRVLAQGRIDELLSRSERLVVEVDDITRALAVAQQLGLPARAEGSGRLVLDRGDAAAVNRALVQAGVNVSGLARERAAGLEERFVEMTEGGSTADA